MLKVNRFPEKLAGIIGWFSVLVSVVLLVGVAYGDSNTFVIQPGSEGKDTSYGTVYATNGTPDSESLYMGGWGDWYYDFFEFDLSGSLSAENTVSATFYLCANTAVNDPKLQMYRITESWTESSVTLSSNPASVFYKNFGSFPVSSSSVCNSVDITDLYKSWKNGTYPNYGIKLVPTMNNQTNGGIYSSDSTNSNYRPKLVITYMSTSCTFTTSPTSQTFTSSGGTGSVTVTPSASSCAWTASESLSWVSINSGSSGTGSGTVSYTVSANVGESRTGTLTIAGQTFTVTQSGVSCGSNSIYPTSTSVSSSGGTGSVSVTATSGCSWTASSSYSWITITSGSSGSGSGTVYYSVSSNTSTSSRSGTLTIAGQTFTVTQSANTTDTTAPTGSISINSGASYANSTSVTLNLSASDSVGVTGYYISSSSSTPSSSASGWTSISSATSYIASVSYTLSSGDGTKTVYVWYKDSAGNVSSGYSKSIILDVTAPTNGSLSATGGSGQVSLSWSGFSDSTSGIASYKLVYSTGSTPSSCSSGTQIYSSTGTSYTHSSLTSGTTYYYRVCATDNAGNTSTGATASASITTSANSTLNVPFLSQRNSSWGCKQLGTCTDCSNCSTCNTGTVSYQTIYKYGCFLTSKAMLFNYYQSNYTDPGLLNTCLKDSSGYSNYCDMNWNDACVPSGVKYVGQYPETGYGTLSSLSATIDSELSSGYPVLASIRYNTDDCNDFDHMHMVVIVAKNGSTYVIKDPWDTTETSRTLDNGALGQYSLCKIQIYHGPVPSSGDAQNNCAASVSSSLVVHIPIVNYNGSNYWADLQYNSATSTLTVAGADKVTDISSYSNCTASSLSSGGLLHIPVVMISGVSYWVDLQYNYNGSAFVVAGSGKN